MAAARAIGMVPASAPTPTSRVVQSDEELDVRRGIICRPEADITRSPVHPLSPTSLVATGDPNMPITERLRIEAARRLAHDEELEAIEEELRRDLHARGAHLQWDEVRRGVPWLPGVPALESLEACEAKSVVAARLGKASVAAGTMSPYLTEFFVKMESRASALLSDPERLLALALDPKAKEKVTEESKAWFEAEAKPLLEKSFQRHDAKGNNVLDKQEAEVFFTHLAHEGNMAKALSAMSLQAGIKMCLGMLQSLTRDERIDIRPQLEHQLAVQLQDARAAIQRKEKTYWVDKAARDAAAFDVLDVNRNGTIELSEFIAAFEPETDTNRALHLALGFTTREEVEQQQNAEALGAAAYRKLHAAVVARGEG